MVNVMAVKLLAGARSHDLHHALVGDAAEVGLGTDRCIGIEQLPELMLLSAFYIYGRACGRPIDL